MVISLLYSDDKKDWDNLLICPTNFIVLIHQSRKVARGGLVLCKQEFGEWLDKGCPAILGGPLPHIMAAKAIALREASQPAFQTYAHKIVENARSLAQHCIEESLHVLTGGPDNHLFLLDVTRTFGLTGRQAESTLRECAITLNRNSLPFDENGPWYTSGLRIGTPAITTLGMGTEEMKEIANVIKLVLSNTTPAVTNSKQSRAKYILNQEIIAEAQQRIQALYGPVGIGKTHIAIEYIYRHQREYQTTLWFNTSPPKLLSANILSLAAQLGIPAQDMVDEQQRIDAIKRWLHHHDRWLLVIDNLENFSLLDQLLPLNSSGHVLLITQSQTTGLFTSRLAVDEMSIEDGALLLLRSAHIISAQSSLDAASENDRLQAMKIAQEFRGYPLALDQAGAYIEETQRQLASYLELYQKKQAFLLGKRGREVSDHPDPVTTTLALTFQKIAQLNPDALELLHFFAFLHPDALPDALLMHGASTLNAPLRAVASDPIALDTAIATLRRFSLIRQRTDSTTLNMHHLVQVVLKNDLPKKQQHQLASQAVRLLNFIFPAVRFETWEGCERYLPQAVHCATLIDEYNLKLQEAGLLLERLGFYYYQRGCYADAETYLTQALQLQEGNSRSDPADMAQALNSLALLYQQLARYEQAETLYQRSLEIRERLLGPEHPKTAESLHNLAMLHGDRGNYQEARRLYLRVLALEEQAKGADHPDIASTLNNLALISYQQGRYSEAKATYERALAIYERALPPNHPNLTYLLDGLATLAEKQGKYERAEELYQRALDISREAFGDEHVETAHSISKLADIAESQGNYPQAEARYRQALTIYEQALGPHHPDIAPVLNNMAFLAKKQGLYAQAEPLYERALTIYKQALGSLHPDLASVLNNLGQLARKTGNVVRAEALLRRVLVIHEQAFEQAHPDTAQSLNNLADLLTDQHRYQEAEPFYQQALTIYMQTVGQEHVETIRVREKYADLLERINKQKSEDFPSTKPSQNDHQA